MELPKLINISENLRRRILSAAILAPIVLLIIMEGGILFDSLILLAAIIMIVEWSAIIYNSKKKLTKKQKQKWLILGISYVFIFALSLLYLRSMQGGSAMVVMIVLIVWATDIAAYITGKLIGGIKLVPAISPGKTWAGLAGGVIAASLVGAFFSVFIHVLSVYWVVLLAGLLAIISQMGDIFESWFKRKFMVKDSGNIIPGHGGLLDRVDGLVFVAPVIAVMSAVTGSFF